MNASLFDAGMWHSLLSLVLAATVIMGSPGPATMSAAAVGAAFGYRRALPYVSGLILGTSTVLLAVAVGLVSILMSMPRLAPVLLILAMAYIVYLAYKIATAPPLSRPDADIQAPRLAGGYLLAVANPKAYFAIAAVFAGARFAAVPPLAGTLIKIAALTAMIVVIHAVWLTAGSTFARLLHRPVVSRIVNLAFAAVLVGTAALAVLR